MEAGAPFDARLLAAVRSPQAAAMLAAESWFHLYNWVQANVTGLNTSEETQRRAAAGTAAVFEDALESTFMVFSSQPMLTD